MPAAKTTQSTLEVSAPDFRWVEVTIEGTTPYCQNAFPQKAVDIMIAAQEKGSSGKSSRKRDPKDFDDCYRQAQHISEDGWNGIPASAFRAGMISACRTIGVVMTRAKLAVYVEPDGFDVASADPLVKITRGKPTRKDSAVRNESGVADIRPRPVWAPGWRAKVNIRYDNDMLKAEDVVNLLSRTGMQVGIGEGRPDSKKSAGIGWGLFKVINEGK